MLSRAFASASSTSLTSSGGLGHVNLTHSLSSTQLLSESNDEELQYDGQDDSIHGANAELEHRNGSDDLLDVFGGVGEMEGLPATAVLCSSRSAELLAQDESSRSPFQSPFASTVRSRPPVCPTSTTAEASYYGSSVAIPQRQCSNPFPQLARSCPKPINMPRKMSHNSSVQDQDELSVFIPPHELAASSLMDPSYVAESLSRKGSAALRLRSAALRKTGFYEGHTETLRVSSSFKP